MKRNSKTIQMNDTQPTTVDDTLSWDRYNKDFKENV